jgi:high affinity sulfate transporter 1
MHRSGSRGRAIAPIAEWMTGYRREWLRPDVIAGLTTAAVVIPKAMAYATIAGLPVQVGLYTAFVPMLIYAVLGTSRPLSVSTTTTLAILVGAQIGLVAPGGDAAAVMKASATLTLMVGVILVLAAVLRLGFVANFISDPVLTGFKAGIGLVIVVDQIPKLLGVHIDKAGFLHNIRSIVRSLPETSWPTLAVGGAVIAMLLALEHFLPRAPAPLIAVAAAIAGVKLFGLTDLGVAVVGAVPTGLPRLTLPDLALAHSLWAGAIGIALMSFTETVAAGRAFAKSDERVPRPNQELFATGIGNAAGAILGSMAAGGGTSQTAVNRVAGAHTQLSQVVTAVGTLLTMLFLAPWIGLMPQATLAAVVIVYSIGLIQPKEFVAIRKIRVMEFRWAVIACLGVVALGTLRGIVVAIVISLAALAYQAANPSVHILGRKRGTNVFRPLSKEHPDDETFPGLLMIRIDGSIFFANTGMLADKVRPLVEQASPKVVALELAGVPDLEYSALKSLTEAEARLRERGAALWLVKLNPTVLAMVQRCPLGAMLGRERMFFNMETAVARYLENRESRPS